MNSGWRVNVMRGSLGSIVTVSRCSSNKTHEGGETKRPQSEHFWFCSNWGSNWKENKSDWDKKVASPWTNERPSMTKPREKVVSNEVLDFCSRPLRSIPPAGDDCNLKEWVVVAGFLRREKNEIIQSSLSVVLITQHTRIYAAFFCCHVEWFGKFYEK